MKGGKSKAESRNSESKLAVKKRKSKKEKKVKDLNKPKREQFRAEYKEKHPDNKSVAAVSISASIVSPPASAFLTSSGGFCGSPRGLHWRKIENAQRLLELHLASGFHKCFSWFKDKLQGNHVALVQEGKENARLVAYAIINAMAMRKILKKYDKSAKG